MTPWLYAAAGFLVGVVVGFALLIGLIGFIGSLGEEAKEESRE